MEPFTELNKGKPYGEQIKPFNFLLTAHVKQLGHPLGANPERFHLIAPYESDPRKWPNINWIDQYTGVEYRITTAGHHGMQHAARVKTYGAVVREYEFHPEAKCADAYGKPCTKQTVGLLQRRHIRIKQITYIGKESNRLEEVESGVVQSGQDVYTEYPDPRRDHWKTTTRPALQKISLATLMKTVDGRFSRRTLIDWRAGHSRPHRKNQNLLTVICRRLGLA